MAESFYSINLSEANTVFSDSKLKRHVYWVETESQSINLFFLIQRWIGTTQQEK